MKRLALMMAAAACVAVATPLAAPAFADQGRRAERAERGGGPDRGGQERGGRRYDDDRGRGRGDDGRGRAPVLGYGDDRPRYAPQPRYEPRPRDDDRRRYDGAPRARGFAPAPPTARRGGYLPRDFSGEIVDDYRRYRLRTPPAGFAWVRMGRGFALVSMRDGQVFDVVQ